MTALAFIRCIGEVRFVMASACLPRMIDADMTWVMLAGIALRVDVMTVGMGSYGRGIDEDQGVEYEETCNYRRISEEAASLYIRFQQEFHSRNKYRLERR